MKFSYYTCFWSTDCYRTCPKLNYRAFVPNKLETQASYYLHDITLPPLKSVTCFGARYTKYIQKPSARPPVSEISLYRCPAFWFVSVFQSSWYRLKLNHCQQSITQNNTTSSSYDSSGSFDCLLIIYCYAVPVQNDLNV
jgi:hypothetical protein